MEGYPVEREDRLGIWFICEMNTVGGYRFLSLCFFADSWWCGNDVSKVAKSLVASYIESLKHVAEEGNNCWNVSH